MASTIDAYRELLPLALTWLLGIEAECLSDGRALTDLELKDAYDVGVQHPEKIRILTVDEIRQPEHPLLREAIVEIGLLVDGAAGRAVGYGIEIVAGTESRRLLRHEFRHVYQFEQSESLESFVTSYVESVLVNGYYDSEFERDARLYEHAAAND